MALDPQYITTPNVSTVRISTANANRDGTGTLGTGFTAGSSGSLVVGVRLKATSTTTAGMVRIFLYDGANNRFLDELTVDAITPSATVKAWEGLWLPPALFGRELPLKSGQLLKFSTENAEQFDITVVGGDF